MIHVTGIFNFDCEYLEQIAERLTRFLKSLGNGEWRTKDNQIKIKKVKVTAATNRHKN